MKIDITDAQQLGALDKQTIDTSTLPDPDTDAGRWIASLLDEAEARKALRDELASRGLASPSGDVN